MRFTKLIKNVALAVVAIAASVVVAAPASAAEITAGQKSEIETIIREYLLANPEILFEVQSAYEQKVEAEREAKMASALSDNADAIYRRKEAPTMNTEGTDVTVVEFFDYNCGYCRRAVGDVAKLINGDKKVKYVFKELPIFGKDSEAGARVALAAGLQGKYFEMHQALFSGEGKVDEASSLAAAEKLGLDMAKLKADMTSEAVSAELKSVEKLAQSLGIQGTPHFLVGTKIIPGAPEDLFDRLTKLIGDVRQEGCKVC